MYSKHKIFGLYSQSNETLIKELAQKLAKYHSLKVPIKRSNDWYLSLMDISYESSREKFPLNKMFAENNLKFLMENELKQELIWIKNAIIESKTPFVFCHNDFRSVNILIKTESHNENDRILFCDLENSRYGYRGIDFASIFSEWGRDSGDFLMYWKSLEDNIIPDSERYPNFPNDSTIKAFIAEYVEESVNIYGNEYKNNSLNSVDRILSEVKLFTLLYKLFVVLGFIQVNEGIDGQEFDKILTLVNEF